MQDYFKEQVKKLDVLVEKCLDRAQAYEQEKNFYSATCYLGMAVRMEERKQEFIKTWVY